MKDGAYQFLRQNFFSLLALLFGLIGMYSMIQTLPLRYETDLLRKDVQRNTQRIDEVLSVSDQYETKDSAAVKFDSLNDKLNGIDKNVQRLLDLQIRK